MGGMYGTRLLTHEEIRTLKAEALGMFLSEPQEDSYVQVFQENRDRHYTLLESETFGFHFTYAPLVEDQACPICTAQFEQLSGIAIGYGNNLDWVVCPWCTDRFASSLKLELEDRQREWTGMHTMFCAICARRDECDIRPHIKAAPNSQSRRAALEECPEYQIERTKLLTGRQVSPIFSEMFRRLDNHNE